MMQRMWQRRTVAVLLALAGASRTGAAGADDRAPCPPEMAQLAGYCIDRWEISLVEASSARPLSPYYPPQPKLLARVHEVWQVERDNLGDESARAMPLPLVPSWQRGAFEFKAVSVAGVVPQGYLSYYSARRACEKAGKRLCSEAEWTTACRGARGLKYPYGAHYVAGRCNIHRLLHPAHVLHGSSSIGHTDPRLNLVIEQVGATLDPLLRPTGGTTGCVSSFGQERVYDMVGNLDEWVEDPKGVFVGGFYARVSTKGCEAKIAGHAPSYYDYSTGARCCRDLDKAD
jgi:hypothetical protein